MTSYELEGAKRKLRWLRAFRHGLVIASFALCTPQVLEFVRGGSATYGVAFWGSCAVNILLFAAVAKVSARVRFLEYQIDYFTNYGV